MAEEIKSAPRKPIGVRSLSSGEFFKREPVDCREFVATGSFEYVYELPAPAATIVPPAVPPVAASEPSRGRRGKESNR